MTFRYLLIYCLSLVSGSGLDECAWYQYLVSNGTNSSSICNQNGACEKLDVSCDVAYDRIISAQRRIVMTPPIHTLAPAPSWNLFEGDYDVEILLEAPIVANLMFEEEIASGLSDDSTRSVLDDLDEKFNLVSDRINDKFPRIFYVDHVDGELLRSIIADIFVLDKSSSHLMYTIFASKSFRKFAWTVSMALDFLLNKEIGFRESEKIIISIAPYLHAFSRILFILEFDSPTLFQPPAGFLECITQFHPIYTNDDGVWYVRQVISNRIEVPRLFFVTTRGDLEMMWSDLDYPQTLIDPLSLLEVLRSSITVSFLLSSTNPIFELVLTTIKFFSEFDRPTYTQLVDAGLFRIPIDVEIFIRESPDMAEIGHSILQRLPREYPTTIDRIKTIKSASSINFRIPIKTRDQTKIIRLNQTSLITDFLAEISNMSRFDLAGTLVLDPPIDRQTLVTELLSGMFESHFVGSTLKENVTRHVARAIGRTIGLIIIMGNPGRVLKRYINQDSENVFQSLFFSSREIQRGFFDVFQSFHFTTTSSLLEALDLMSENRYSFMTPTLFQ